MKKLQSVLKISDKNFAGLLMMLAAILLVIYFGKGDSFYTSRNLLSVAAQFPQFGIMSLGVMLAMILGGIDLSFVGLANLATIVASLLLKSWIVSGETPQSQAALYILLAVAVALVIGAAGGCLNGLLISYIGIPPILATLGTQQLYTGLCIVITGGSAVSGVPKEFVQLASWRLFGVLPLPLIVFILCALIVGLMMKRTAFGKKLYMLGTNPKAAVYSGLRDHRLTVTTFAISGVLAVIGGLLMVARMGSAKAYYGSSYVMQCILIVVLGGVDPNGGFGKTRDVILAILILQAISSGLNMFPELSSYYKQLVWGAVLLLVMIVKFYAAKGSAKRQEKTSKKGG